MENIPYIYYVLRLRVMRNNKRVLEREELEDILLRGTFIEAGDMETMGWASNPRNRYIWLTESEKNNNIKL